MQTVIINNIAHAISISLTLTPHTQSAQRAFVFFLLLWLFFLACPLACPILFGAALWCGLGSSSKFNAKVKQSDYVLGSIKVAVLMLLFFSLLVFTNGHTITQYTTENVWGYNKMDTNMVPVSRITRTHQINKYNFRTYIKYISKCMHGGSVSIVGALLLRVSSLPPPPLLLLLSQRILVFCVLFMVWNVFDG